MSAALGFGWQAHNEAMAQTRLDCHNLAATVLKHAVAFVRRANLVAGMVVRLNPDVMGNTLNLRAPYRAEYDGQ